jgi:hypothetical protein
MKKNLLFYSMIMAGTIAIAQTPRLCLYEEFTGENCPPCASANPALNALLNQPANAAKIVAIKWQVPIPSAPSATWSLYKTNKAEIDWRYRSVAGGGYGYGISSAPSGLIDGQNCNTFGASSNHPNNLNSGVISTAQSYTSAFSVNIARDWDRTCSSVNLTITIQATAPFTSVGNLNFRTVMVERHIQFATAPGTNGEKIFEDVGIKSFPSIQAGTPLPNTWTIGQSHTFTLNCQIPSYARKKQEIAFVGLIQDDGNRRVAQTVRADKTTLPAEGLAILATNVNITCNNFITPTVSIKNEGPAALTNFNIIPYVDGVQGNPIPWTGNIAPGATEVISLGSISSPTISGSHQFSFEVDMNSSYNLSANLNKTNYMVVSDYQATPVSENFVATFPPAKWGISNPNGGATWVKSSTVGWGDSFSAKCELFSNNVAGDKDELFLPPMNLSGGEDPVLFFDRSCAMRNASSADQLDVYASSDCGATWTNVFSRSGSQLATVVNPVSFEYFPESGNFSQWLTEYVGLPGFNKPNVVVKFVTTASGLGNNLFLDNVNLLQSSGVGLSKSNNDLSGVTLYPNPASDQLTIRISTIIDGTAKISITNTLGQVVSTSNVAVEKGKNDIATDIKALNNGVYIISVETAQGTTLKLLNVSK